MSLLDYYRSCYAADWQYEYADGETYRRGRKQIEDLRNQTVSDLKACRGARLEIFDRCQRAAVQGTAMPEFGDIAVTSADADLIKEAIAYHDQKAQTAWTEAARVQERGAIVDAQITHRYHLNNALLSRLREQQARLKDKAA